MAAKAGAYLTVITAQEYIGKGLDQVSLTAAMAALSEPNIKTLPFHEIATVNEQSVMVRCLCSGRLQPMPCDMIVLGIPPRQVALPTFLPASSSLHTIGDAKFPRGVEFALLDAQDLIRTIVKQQSLS